MNENDNTNVEQAFETARDFIFNAILQKFPAFNIHKLETEDPELFWQLADCGVRVAKLTNPESVLWILDEFTGLVFKIAQTQQEGESHAHIN